MIWQTLYTDEYEDLFLRLTDAEQIDVQVMVEVLEIKGPNLGHPYAARLTKRVKKP